jgi:hypothetical protein
MDDNELLLRLDDLMNVLHTMHDHVSVNSRKLSFIIEELASFRAEFHQQASVRGTVPWTPSRGG